MSETLIQQALVRIIGNSLLWGTQGRRNGQHAQNRKTPTAVECVAHPTGPRTSTATKTYPQNNGKSF